jgi:hypothetical protein
VVVGAIDQDAAHARSRISAKVIFSGRAVLHLPHASADRGGGEAAKSRAGHPGTPISLAFMSALQIA